MIISSPYYIDNIKYCTVKIHVEDGLDCPLKPIRSFQFHTTNSPKIIFGLEQDILRHIYTIVVSYFLYDPLTNKLRSLEPQYESFLIPKEEFDFILDFREKYPELDDYFKEQGKIPQKTFVNSIMELTMEE